VSDADANNTGRFFPGHWRTAKGSVTPGTVHLTFDNGTALDGAVAADCGAPTTGPAGPQPHPGSHQIALLPQLLDRKYPLAVQVFFPFEKQSPK
jgi:hypothetical protein